MSTRLEKLTELKTTAERQQREADESKGALDVELKRLKDDFDCSSLKKAEKVLADWEEQAEKAAEEFDEEYERLIKDSDGKL
ncbi:MAG: hypothetical protein IID16_03615 [Candidatus Marinimicrobia bacterium]|nr:hypothetical protein [Candidatus Neomarinimicrobiota bacterium]